ncbi:MAG: tRNA-5-methyluridine54 2-sulfurtransferase [Candidatus Diapherotrites archaeon]|nr:tRNA-5-methyluridine54 2-sulfurtransferase [Candidatus Diapherotrites archaeon]MDN5367133.1 tRNA-5-methyluridine54 2-sulfurtransferase [Candidatus Diapherotrites archaeon]
MAKSVEERVLGLIRGEKLVRKGDKVMVAVSGGKDSSTAAWILAKHAEELGIEVALLHLDQGIPTYSKNTRKKVEELAKELEVPLYVHEWEKEWGNGLPYIVGKIGKASCYICGILKRYYQNVIPKALGYNVVATGHNLDDSVGFIINNLITGQIEYIAKLAPVLPETELTPRKIKPLFWIQEWEIRKYAEENGVPFAPCQCPFQTLAPTYKIRRAFDDVEKARPGTRKSFVKNVMRLAQKAGVRADRTKPNACKYCGAPTSGRVCAVCRMKKKVGIELGPVKIQEENWIGI